MKEGRGGVVRNMCVPCVWRMGVRGAKEASACGLTYFKKKVLLLDLSITVSLNTFRTPLNKRHFPKSQMCILPYTSY